MNERRRLLQLLAGGSLALSLADLGCGDGSEGGQGGSGGSGGTGPGTDDPTGVKGGGNPGDPVSAADRAAALGDIEAAFADLVGTGTTFDPASMIDRLRTHPALSRVGYTASSRCGWAVFTDGRKVILGNNVSFELPPAGPAGLRARVHRRIRGLGSGDVLVCRPQLRNVNMLGDLPVLDYRHVTVPFVESDTISRISRIAKGLGYFDVDLGTVDGHARIGDVDGLRNVEGDGVFLFTSVGGNVNAEGNEIASWWTLTQALVDGKVRPEYESALDEGSLVYHLVPTSVEGAGTRLGITPEFARNAQWSFPPNSLVFLNGPGLAFFEWLSTLQAAGAGLVLGWSGPAHLATCVAVAQDFFEMNFATNRFEGEPSLRQGDDPPYRGIGMGAVLDYLDAQGYLNRRGLDEKEGTFQFFPGSGGIVSQLRPSITYLTLKLEDGLVELVGEFGTDSGHVRIGPQLRRFSEPELEDAADPELASYEELPIVEWRSDLIRAQLRDGQAGLVQVSTGPLYGNALPITRWRLKFQLERTVGGELHRSASIELTVRAPTTGWRKEYGDDPLSALHRLTIVNDASFSVGYSSSGSTSKKEGDTTTTLTWSGAGNFGKTEGLNLLTFSGEVDLQARVIKGILVVVAGTGLHVLREVTRDGKTTIEEDRDTSFGLGSTASASGYAFTENLDEHLAMGSGATSWDDMESVLGEMRPAHNTLTWQMRELEFPLESDRYGR